MLCKDKLPKSLEELKQLPYDDKVFLWRRYSQNSFKRQMKPLWYYIQCERLNLHLEKKYLAIINKYKEDPDLCLNHACKTKYNFTPGTVLTKYFKGIKHEVLVNDDGTFTYNDTKYKSLSSIAIKITGAKISGISFFGINKHK